VCSPAWKLWLDVEVSKVDGAVQVAQAAIGNHRPLSVIGVEEKTAVLGWRGRRTLGAIQIILHIYHRPGDSQKIELLELDFDHANPSDGLAGLVLHGVESAYYRWRLPFGGKQIRTNPFRIAKRLARLERGGKVA
jgi:hypothetical protein